MHAKFNGYKHPITALFAGLVAASLTTPLSAAAETKQKPAPQTSAVVLPRPSPARNVAAKPATVNLPVMGMASETTVPSKEALTLYQQLSAQTLELDSALDDRRSGRKPWTPALRSFAALIDEVGKWRGADAAALLTATWTNTYMRGENVPAKNKSMLEALSSGQGSEEVRAMLAYYVLSKYTLTSGIGVFQTYEDGIKKPGKTRTVAMIHNDGQTFIIDTHLMPNQATLSLDDFRQQTTAAGFVPDDSGFTGLNDSSYFDPEFSYWPLYAVTFRGFGSYPDAPAFASKAKLPAAGQNKKRSAVSISPIDRDDFAMAVTKIALQAVKLRNTVVTGVPDDKRLLSGSLDTLAAAKTETMVRVRDAVTGTDIELKSDAELQLLVVGPKVNGAFSLFQIK